MRIFIWPHNYSAKLTARYHQGGGAVALAPDLETARKLLIEKGALPDGRITTEAPAFDWPLAPGAGEPWAEVFPNAGCC